MARASSTRTELANASFRTSFANESNLSALLPILPTDPTLPLIEQMCETFGVPSTERSPSKCPNGHQLAANTCLVVRLSNRTQRWSSDALLPALW